MIYQLPAQTGYLLHEHAQAFHGAGAGYLSIKSFYRGNAQYAIGSRRLLVDDSCYLILNNGQFYSVQIEGQQPVESFCLFFAPGFAEAIQHTLAGSTESAVRQSILYSQGLSEKGSVRGDTPHQSSISGAPLGGVAAKWRTRKSSLGGLRTPKPPV
ncbi:MAG TPA: hypothetical protein VFU22_03235 [Roseiflexaceae bacterium]|nr:hypothetical protein [Roseiflexaceae bacterium]